MAKATILALGDPGPVRNELLLRKDINVLWVASPDDALSILGESEVDACIIADDAPDAVRVAQAAAPRPTVIVMRSSLTHSGWPAESRQLRFSPVDDPGEVLTFLAPFLGLRFAAHPRVPAHHVVRVEVDGEHHLCRALNLSASGIAIRGFPEKAPGTRASLVLELSGTQLYLDARVIRCFASPHGHAAGLSFVDLGELPRAAIVRFVEDRIVRDVPKTPAENALFGDLGIEAREGSAAIATEDMDAPPLPADFTNATDDFGLPLLEQLTLKALTPAQVPEWIAALGAELTPIERAAAAGLPVPGWAHRILRLRLQLAQARSDDALAKAPAVLVNEAYRWFARLPELTQGMPGNVVTQVGQIRAQLIREILGHHGHTRRGTEGVAEPELRKLA